MPFSPQDFDFEPQEGKLQKRARIKREKWVAKDGGSYAAKIKNRDRMFC